MSEHTTNASCSTCHKLMDGVGFGLEKFDAIGARRDQLVLEFRIKSKEGDDDDEEGIHAKKRIVTLPLNTSAYVAGIPNSDFTSPAQLGAVLAKSAQCQDCVVKQYFRFQAGRTDTASDRPLIRMVSDDFRNSGFKFKELIVSLMVLREFPNNDSHQTSVRPIAPKPGDLQHVADNHRTR
jgi:hypothetical protein